MARLRDKLKRGWSRFKKFVSGAWRGGKKVVQVVAEKAPQIIKTATDVADKFGASNNDTAKKISGLIKKGAQGAQTVMDKGHQFYDKNREAIQKVDHAVSKG